MSAEPAATTLSWYLERVGRTPLRSPEEEVDLAKRVQAGRAAAALSAGAPGAAAAARLRRIEREGRRATEVLAEANLRLVVSMARRFQGRGLDLLDLVQEGSLGLLTAVERFDPGRGYRFSTYASWWIRQAITRGLATRGRAVRLPVHAYEVMGRLRRLEVDLWQRHGRPPADEDLAAALEVSLERLGEIRRAHRELVSLDVTVGDEGTTTLGSLVPDEATPGPEAVTAASASRRLVADALATLQPRDREVLALRYGLEGNEPHTLDQIGRRLDLTRERIRQIELRALARLAASPHRHAIDAVGA